MTTQAVSQVTQVTLETLHNYRVAATQAVAAYHAGGQRLVDAVNGTVESQIVPRTAKLAPRAAERMDAMRGNVNAIVVKGLDQVVERTGVAIERSSDVAAAQLEKVAGLAAEIDNTYVANSLAAAARLTLPMARLALVVSSKVAEGATALADAAGAHPVKKAARRAVASAKGRAAPVARRAKAQMKTAARRVSQHAGKVATQVTRRAKAA